VGSAAPVGDPIIRIRAAIGPLIIGVSTWCAAASATARETASSAPGSGWVLLAAMACAALIPGVRRRPIVALPALISTLPSIPLAWPAVVLMWTGPLAFVPIAASLAAAVGTGWANRLGDRLKAADTKRATVLSGIATLVAGLFVVWAIVPRVPRGDEPHYLVIALSLLKDGDLRIENNHRDPDYIDAFGELKPDFIQPGRKGAIYSIHAPGLAVLVLPAFALFGYRGAAMMVLLVGAAAGSIIWRIGWRTTRDVNAAWFAWAAIALSVTFLIQSATVFPDVPGALCVAAGLLLYLCIADPTEKSQSLTTSQMVAGSAALAALPWLHTRFAIPAGVIGFLIVSRLAIDQSRSLSDRRTLLVAFLALPVLSAIGWFAYFQVIYGTPNPAAPYGDTSGPDGTHARYIPGGLAALLFDQQFGLLAYAPVLAAGVAGLWMGGKSVRRVTTASIAIIAPYLLAVTAYWMWWAGRPAPPARFATAVLPALAPCLAIAWARGSEGARRTMLALLGVTVAITTLVLSVGRGALAWNDRDAHARLLDWLSPSVSLARGWPSFFWRLDPPQLSSEWPFFLHAALAVVILVSGWLLLRRLMPRRSADPALWNTAIALWLLVGSMAVTQAGWFLNGVNGFAAYAGR
jgi:hypothetical protein